jgi:DNA-binding transcriptional MerR regulator
MHGIGEFSRLCQIPVKTLRYYDAIGLLRPARVQSQTGYRCYAARQLEQVNRILALKDIGFSLREIRMLLAERVPPDQVRAMLREKLQHLEQGVNQARARLARAAARLESLDHDGYAGAQEVAVRHLRPRLVATVRDTLGSHEECARLFDELFRRTREHPGRRPRGAVWHTCAAGAVECEAFVVLPARIDCAEGVSLHEVPAQHVASLVYRGDQEYLPAYRAIRAWLARSGAAIIGPKREIYLEDGGPDTESVTEIQFPIAAPVDPVH